MKIRLSFPLFFLLTNLLGLAVSIFLWYVEQTYVVRGCIGGGCEIVLFSKYSYIFGVPIAVWGAFFYGVGVLVSKFRYFDDRPILRLFSWIHGAGSILGSAYFLYLELFLIHAICSWCKASTLATIILFILTIVEIRRRGGFTAIHNDIKTLYN